MSNNPIHRKTKRHTNHNRKTFTVDDAREMVIKIKQLEGLSPNSIVNYEKLFNDFDQFFGEKTDITSLTTEDARNFIYWQLHNKIQFKNHKYRKDKKIGVSITSANLYLAYGKGAFTVLVNEEVVEKNVFQGINNIKQSEKKVETLSVDEIKTLLRSLNKEIYSEFRLYCFLNLALDSFGRVNEILSLSKSDIDFDCRTVIFTQTKNRKIRMLPITKKTCKLIKELIEENEDFGDTDYIFLTNHGKHLRPDTLRKHLREVVQRLGIEKRIHPHLFRHSASEMFLKQNGSIRVLQKILDHHSPDVTMRYAHVLDETIKAQHEQFTPLNLIDEVERRKTRRNK
ncbi:tyrosine-type recombinase/integrase [Fictibacillus phosphorivorans]|uniref:tyrosine-type recombinase/integrase n=1 Tax=Fictibacillus phosphorivorans TaxID=1221500 RepID=UPI0035EF3B2D